MVPVRTAEKLPTAGIGLYPSTSVGGSNIVAPSTGSFIVAPSTGSFIDVASMGRLGSIDVVVSGISSFDVVVSVIGSVDDIVSGIISFDVVVSVIGRFDVVESVDGSVDDIVSGISSFDVVVSGIGSFDVDVSGIGCFHAVEYLIGISDCTLEVVVVTPADLAALYASMFSLNISLKKEFSMFFRI